MVLPWERFQILIVCVVVACSFHFLPLLCHYVLLLQIHDNQTNVETGSNLSIHLEPNPKWHVFAICLQVFSGFLRPEKRAVNGISLAIPNGECFGLLGVNGWWNLYQSSVSWKHMTSALCTCIVWSMWLREHADEQTTIIIMWLDSINIMKLISPQLWLWEWSGVWYSAVLYNLLIMLTQVWSLEFQFCSIALFPQISVKSKMWRTPPSTHTWYSTNASFPHHCCNITSSMSLFNYCCRNTLETSVSGPFSNLVTYVWMLTSILPLPCRCWQDDHIQYPDRW